MFNAYFIEPILLGLGALIMLIAIFSTSRQNTTRLQAANKKIDELSARMEKQEADLLKQQCLYDLDKRLSKIRTQHPTPAKAWMNYAQLKQDLDAPLNGWITTLEKQLPLSEREIQFCVYYVIYSNLTLENIATHICYTEKSIRNYKYRIAQKLGLPSANLADYLQNNLYSHMFTPATDTSTAPTAACK
jgi:DNA-binding NarL/FixJ family response regulator